MVGLHIVDPADVAFRAWNLTQPRAAASIIARPRADPDVVHAFIAKHNGINPCQDVVTARRLPSLYIGLRRAGRKGILQIEAALPTLQAFEPCSRHVMSTRKRDYPPASRTQQGSICLVAINAFSCVRVASCASAFGRYCLAFGVQRRPHCLHFRMRTGPDLLRRVPFRELR